MEGHLIQTHMAQPGHRARHPPQRLLRQPHTFKSSAQRHLSVVRPPR